MPLPPGAFWTNDDAHVASLRVVFGWIARIYPLNQYHGICNSTKNSMLGAAHILRNSAASHHSPSLTYVCSQSSF